MLRYALLGLATVLSVACSPVSVRPAPRPTSTVPVPTIAVLAEPTPSPIPTPIAGVMGETLTAPGGLALTVYGAEMVEGYGYFVPTEEGYVFLVLDVLFENTGSEPVEVEPGYFRLKDGEGFQYSWILGPDPELHSTILQPGEKARGNVTFELPPGATGLVLSYEWYTAAAQQSPAPFRVTLN